MEDYMTLIRVYFQSAIAATIGITNIALLPDLRVFKSTFKVKTERGKLGLGEKAACRKMLKQMYGHDDAFFKEIDHSINKNCRKMQDVQTYLYQFQGDYQQALEYHELFNENMMLADQEHRSEEVHRIKGEYDLQMQKNQLQSEQNSRPWPQ